MTTENSNMSIVTIVMESGKEHLVSCSENDAKIIESNIINSYYEFIMLHNGVLIRTNRVESIRIKN